MTELPPAESQAACASEGDDRGWARPLYARQIAVLGELAEAGLEVALAIRDQVKTAAAGGEDATSTAMAYARAARAVVRISSCSSTSRGTPRLRIAASTTCSASCDRPGLRETTSTTTDSTRSWTCRTVDRRSTCCFVRSPVPSDDTRGRHKTSLRHERVRTASRRREIGETDEGALWSTSQER